MDTQVYVGIDVSARTLSVAWGRRGQDSGPARTFEQTRSGYRALISHLKASGYAAQAMLVVMEATGTYWMQAAHALYAAGFGVSVINPRQAHHFAQALLRQAKTDAIDAHTLARLAATLDLPRWQAPGPVWEALYQRLVEHDQLVHMRQMLRNQLHALCRRVQPDPQVIARMQAQLDLIQQQLQAIEDELEGWLKRGQWADLSRRLRAIKGIGLLSAAWLLVITNGFSTCQDAEQLASYLGLVPHPLHSGQSRRHRPLGLSGHARARRVLYQAAVSAARFNPPITAFYQRLLARGKHLKVARCAAARKLVHQVFAIVTRELPCDHHILFTPAVPSSAA